MGSIRQSSKELTFLRDIHSHILPGVDDGARNLTESLAMIEAAREVGVTDIVCTPHCRDPYFDYELMWDAFTELSSEVEGISLQMGFEVYHDTLLRLGADKWADYLCFDGSKEFLLEFSPQATAKDFESYFATIANLQARGFQVIIAHPERYRAIQNNIEIARRLVRQGCKLQASADFINGGRFKSEKKPAKSLFDEMLYSYLASDAHCPDYYEYLGTALSRYQLRGKHARNE